MSRHVALHVWRVSGSGVPVALARMAIDRVRLRDTPGLRFHKLLGTGDGTTFEVRDADPRTWALLTEWDSRAASTAFERHPTVRGWRRLSVQEWRGDMVPLKTHGQWSQQAALQPDGALAGRWDGPIAAITRARIRVAQMRSFWAAVPAVVDDMDLGRGPSVRLGIGEAPVGVQGTFSIWPDLGALTDFAYRRSPHRAVVAETAARGWYTEELFARLALVEERGVLFGEDRTRRYSHA